MNILDTIKAYVELARILNCMMAFFAVAVGALIVTGNMGVMYEANLLYAAFAAMIIMAAGNMLNDYFDVDIDKINRPGRPIPSHRVEKSDVSMLAFVFFFMGVALAKINAVTLAIAVFNAVLLIAYAKFSKRLVLLSNFAVAYLIASTFIFGAASVSPDSVINPESLNEKTILLFALCAFFINLSREILKDIEDIEGDIMANSVTLPIMVGEEKAKRIASIFGVFAIALSFVPYAISAVGGVYVLFILIADTLFVFSLRMHPSLGQRTQVYGMIIALIAFVAGVF